jgi:hypothetical protein
MQTAATLPAGFENVWYRTFGSLVRGALSHMLAYSKGVTAAARAYGRSSTQEGNDYYRGNSFRPLAQRVNLVVE